MHSLKDILFARSIAVVGASADPLKMGHILLKNLIEGGYKGDLYPVNLKEENILGLPCIKSVTDIKGNLDLVIICVPAKLAQNVIHQAGAKGALAAIVISGGFKEIGNDQMERDLVDAAKSYGMRVIGPNCQGVNYTANRMCATWPLVRMQGVIGIVSQSGTIGAEMELLAEKDGIGVSCFAALGNKSDIDEADFIDFFIEDPNTKVIAINIEGIKDAQRFTDTVTRAVKKKPVVILKPGRTEKGKIAVASHTKSVAGNDRVFSAFCKKHGILRAFGMDDFYDLCKLSIGAIPPLGKRLLILTSSGGAGILAADTVEDMGLDLPVLDESLRNILQKVLPPQCVLSNPLDLTGDATSERYEAALNEIIKQNCFDMILVIFGDPITGACRVLENLRSSIPAVACYLGGGEVQKQEELLMNQAGIPVFPTPERAVKAIAALVSSAVRERGIK